MYSIVSKYQRKIAASFAVLLATACFSIASALDVDEVKTLLENRVPEEVIINMVEGDGTIYITHEEADVFRSLGASENLVAALRPTATTLSPSAPYTAPTTAARQPTVVTNSTPTIITNSTPTVVAESAVIVESATPPDGSPITPVSITNSTAYPPRYDKEGWVVFSNHDWVPYYLNVNSGNKRLFLSKFPNGGMAIESGSSVVVNLRKESYKMYGDSGNDLKVKVREGETTTVALNPFGVFGNSGLTGVSVDRDKVRSEVLFTNYAPPPAVVIQEAPVYVVPGPPRYYHRPYDFHFGYGRW